ncbi:MAG TPA: DUF4384 domain-containing protein [Nitrospirota bacterium]|nr:DUF4384 domain-containing protein [Nitrospirota bacterium]
MRYRFVLLGLLLLMFVKPVYGAQSTITEAEGTACMGDDKSRKQTEEAALSDAKKKAVEYVSTYLKSETQVKNFELEKDLVSAYASASVKVIQELDRSWYKDPASGDCLKLKIKAEIVPDEKAMESLSKTAAVADDPSAPLSVKAWTDKKAYKEGEKVKIYIKGNKPFYARVLYKDASGKTVQLLPNPYRTDNYFNGGTMYEIPTGNDKFDLEVSPPFGEENVIVYASSSPLGEISTEARGGVYQIMTRSQDIGIKTRGIKLMEKTGGEATASASKPAASEFFEDKVVVKTGK